MAHCFEFFRSSGSPGVSCVIYFLVIHLETFLKHTITSWLRCFGLDTFFISVGVENSCFQFLEILLVHLVLVGSSAPLCLSVTIENIQPRVSSRASHLCVLLFWRIVWRFGKQFKFILYKYFLLASIHSLSLAVCFGPSLGSLNTSWRQPKIRSSDTIN